MAGPVASDWDCGAGSRIRPSRRIGRILRRRGRRCGGASGSARGRRDLQRNWHTLTNTTGLVIEFNVATGNAGGGGGLGGNALSFQGGSGGAAGNGGSGGEATGNDGGFGGLGGEGFGGGLYNDVGGTVVYKAGKNPKNPTPSLFTSEPGRGLRTNGLALAAADRRRR